MTQPETTNQHDYLAKIGSLLALAENASTEAEADAAMKRAQILASKHAIDVETARQAVKDRTTRQTPIVRNIVLGERGKRGLATYVQLFLGIAAANDVTCNIAHNSTYVNAFGFPTDIDMCEALYASLVQQMVKASTEHLRSGEYRHDTYTGWYDLAHAENDPRCTIAPGARRRTVRIGGADIEQVQASVQVPSNIRGLTARLGFQEGFGRRIKHRLADARAEAIAIRESEEAAAAAHSARDTSTPGTALVLAAKALEVNDFYKARSTARGSWGGNRSLSAARGNGGRSAHSGWEAGGSARLGSEKGIGSGPARIAG